jgi:hypothetical protein
MRTYPAAYYVLFQPRRQYAMLHMPCCTATKWTSRPLLAGTLDELRPITSIDGVGIPNTLDCKPVADVFKAFAEIYRSETDQSWDELFKL